MTIGSRGAAYTCQSAFLPMSLYVKIIFTVISKCLQLLRLAGKNIAYFIYHIDAMGTNMGSLGE